MTARFIVGDTRKVLATLPDASVDLVMCSPPFLALRSYLPADHPDKAAEIGSEATPGEFLDVLLDVVEDCARVLAPHGSLVFELGDTYSGSGGAGGDYNEGGLREDAPKFTGSALSYRKSAVRDRFKEKNGRTNKPDGPPRTGPGRTTAIRDGWPLDKSLCMIPSSFAWALAYGRNPWTGRETPQWRVRNLIAWCRPNPPVGALGDKFRPGSSYLTVACKSRTRWFDLDAVRVPFTGHEGVGTGIRKGQNGDKPTDNRPDDFPTRMNTHAGAPPLDWWEIPTQPYAGAHYATFPERLVVRPVEAMCPRGVCRMCGEPRRRITETEYERSAGGTTGKRRNLAEPDGRLNGTGMQSKPTMSAVTTTIGWTDCGHGPDNYRRGIVLDPFCGSGTTLAIAEGLGRDSIGIDLDARNADLATRRCGMFLAVETADSERAR